MRLLTCLIVSFLAVMTLAAQPKPDNEPITIGDIELLLGMGVPDAKIGMLSAKHCLDQPLNDEGRNALNAAKASPLLMQALGNICVRPPAKLLDKAIRCPEAYSNDPQRKGCISFPRDDKYFQLPRPASGECVLEADVDDVVDFIWQGPLLMYEVTKGLPPVVRSASCNQPLPDGKALIVLAREKGRGKTTVAAQPEAANQFALKVHVEDPGRRQDTYRLRLTWQNAAGQ
jgi:hypothetical protein